MAETTKVHVLRHGEVHNPRGILYGRLAGYGLSERGRAQAEAAAEALQDSDIVLVVASPLQRAQETAAPIAARHGLDVATDPDLIESLNYFEGRRISPGDGAWRDPRVWWQLRNPLHAVMGRAIPGHRRADDDRDRQGACEGGRARGGSREPSTAGVDAASAPRKQAPLARPAAAAVQPRIADVVRLRRRPVHPRCVIPNRRSNATADRSCGRAHGRAHRLLHRRRRRRAGRHIRVRRARRARPTSSTTRPKAAASQVN